MLTAFRGLTSWNTLCRTFTKGWHSVDVDLIECGSDNCNYLLTRCKSVTLRDRLLRRLQDLSSLAYDCMFCEEIQYRREYCVAGHHMRVIFVSSSRAKGVQSNPSLESRKHKAGKFPLLLAAPLLLPQALQSINIWDNLPLPPLYQTDSKSSLGCILCYLIPAVTFPVTRTHSHTHISLPTQYLPSLHGCLYIS